jgi:hypothetical protein
MVGLASGDARFGADAATKSQNNTIFKHLYIIHEHLVYIAMHLSKPSFPWGPDVVRLLVINSALLYLVVNFYYLQEELWCMLLDLAI